MFGAEEAGGWLAEKEAEVEEDEEGDEVGLEDGVHCW